MTGRSILSLRPGAAAGAPAPAAAPTEGDERFIACDVDTLLAEVGWRPRDLQAKTGRERTAVFRWRQEGRLPIYAYNLIVLQKRVRSLLQAVAATERRR